MKKIYIILVLAAFVCLCFTGCSAKCDLCGQARSSGFILHANCPECSLCSEYISFKCLPCYCAHCGYEFHHHCVECGKICNTAFCKSCGAEQ